MQYFTYQHADGTDDVAPYYGNIYTAVMLSFEENADWLIMLGRVKASNRGASPVDVQITVALLDTDNLMQYER